MQSGSESLVKTVFVEFVDGAINAIPKDFVVIPRCPR